MELVLCVLSLFITAAISVALALYLWRYRSVPGATLLAWLMLAVAFWALGYALELASAGLTFKLLWARFKYLGIVSVPVAWFAFTLQYIGVEGWPTRRHLALLSLLPLVTLFFVWTNAVHPETAPGWRRFVWTAVRIGHSDPFPMLALDYGLWFQIHAGYSYLLFLLGLLLLFYATLRPAYLYRAQARVLLASALIPLLGNVLSLAGLSPILHLDLTPFVFMLSGLGVAWGLFRFGLLDIVPMARDVVIDQIADAVIVVDAGGRIVDLNPAASRLLDRCTREAIGQSAKQVFAGLPEALQSYGDVTRQDVILEGTPPRQFELSVSSLQDQRDRVFGHLIVLHDVTNRVKVEETLRQRTVQLEVLRETSLELTARLDLKALLHFISSRSIELLGGSGGGLYLYRPERDVLEWTIATGSTVAVVGVVLRRGEGLAGKVWAQGAPLIVDDYRHWEGRAAVYDGLPLAAVVGVPVCYGDDFLGVLTVEADAPRTFSLDDAELLRLFAAQAAVAIQNARLYEKTQRQSARLAQTLEASEWLHRGLELEQVLQRIAQGATALGFRCAVINVCDPGGERVKVRALLGIAGQERKRLTGATYRWSDFEPLMQERFRVSRSYLVRQGQVDWEREFSEAVVIPRIEDRGPGYWRPEDALLVPLWGALGEPVGLLSVDKPVDGLLPDLDTIQTLEAFANQAAIAIENAQLYQQAQQEIAEREQAERALRQRNRELALLNRIGQELSATLDWREVIHQLLQAVTDIVSAEGASVWMWDEQQTGGLVCRDAFRREHSVALVGLRLEPGQGVAGWVAQTGESAIVPCAPEDPRFFPGIDELTGLHTISLLTVPLRVRDKVIGVLEAVNKLVGAFGVEDRALVETLAASAAVAIQNARLVEALQRRTEALQASNEELGAFGHTVAHDLRDSLHLVVGHAELLAAERATMSDQELERCVQRIAQGGRKMDNIIEALMLLAGLRDQTVERHALNMADIVARAQERLANLVEKSQAEISLPERWPVAWGYGPWVEEVWVNYLSNALKYGGHPPRLTLGAQVLQERGGAVRFWIRDNGAGLTPEEQARLFAPFERLGRGRARGHGLGLSIVRRIVEQLGGQVGVESEPHGSEAGSTFWFTLPGAPVISD